MQILTIISPLVIIGLTGYIAAKTQWFTRSHIDTLSKFTFYIAIPAFLFKQLLSANLNDLSPSLYAAFYLPVLCVYFFAGLLNYFYHPSLSGNKGASAVFGLGASYSNNVIVGLPVITLAIGDQMLPTVFLIVSFHSAMLFGLTIALSNSASFKLWAFIKQTFFNPLVIAILLGFSFNLLGVTFPKALNDSLTLLGKPAVTLALFLLGASLAFYSIKDAIGAIAITTICKLVLLPVLVYLSAYYVFDFSSLTITTLVLLSACPTGVNAYLIAKQQQHHQETLAGGVVVSTVLAIFTIPAWLIFLNT